MAYAAETMIRASGAFFYMDDFLGIQDAGSGLRAALRPYGGHVSYTSGLLWHSLLKVVGTTSYKPFLLMAVILTLCVAVAVFISVRKMTSDAVAVAASVWVLLLGAAFHNQLWDQASLSQIAAIAVIGIGYVGLRSTKAVVITLAIAAIGIGVGGLGFGVALAFFALALTSRRWFLAVGCGLATAGVGLIAAGSITNSSGAGHGFLRSIAAIPSYDFLALETTIAVGLGIPTGAAGALAIVIVVAGAIAAPIAVRRATTAADLALIASGTYLITNWSLAAFVRGIPEEVAAPRYIGITGPLLLIATISISMILRELVPVPTWLAPWRMSNRWFIGTWTVVLLISSWAALPMWLDARTNAAYLGQQNLARLAAMNSGESWIAHDFVPTGEGLTYVREVLIQEAWKRRGYPPLAPTDVAKSPQRSDAFLETALEAGLVSSVSSDVPRPAHCKPTIEFDLQLTRRIIYHGVLDATLTVLTSSPHPVQVTGDSGVITLNAMTGVNRGSISSTTGCFSVEK